MEFSVGDKVMHPGKGAGRIVELQSQELVEGFEHYYVIEIPDQELTVSVPTTKMEDLGVRRVMSRAKLSRVLDTLRGEPDHLPPGYRKRQDLIRTKLDTGQPLLIAEALRDLAWHQQVSHSTKKDADLLARARQFLIGEVCLLTDKDTEVVRGMIDTALAVAAARAAEAAASTRATAA
ncbi:MAG: hypothetical protein KKA73_04150 [Chloroflexi bacterium]|nr:hypothetical protein [Chloroflexota bacterium]MBU1746858.1 hypothetical protein [Chloroflexota bacterium]